MSSIQVHRYMILVLDGILIAVALMDFVLAPAPRDVHDPKNPTISSGC